MVATNVSFQFSPAIAGFARSRKSRDCAEAYIWYVAQAIQQIDPRGIGFAFHGAGAEIAEKGHFWMETS